MTRSAVLLYTPLVAATGAGCGHTSPTRPVPVGEGDQLGMVYVHANEGPPRAHVLFFHGKGPHMAQQFEHIKRVTEGNSMSASRTDVRGLR